LTAERPAGLAWASKQHSRNGGLATVAASMEGGNDMTDRKQKLREETERLVQEALQRKGVTIEKLKTRIDVVCGKCGFRSHVLTETESRRVSFKCKECGHSQNTI
jgi:DNA-directed RNA polymerase subunit M/transcription elongation factor TFIIS